MQGGGIEVMQRTQPCLFPLFVGVPEDSSDEQSNVERFVECSDSLTLRFHEFNRLVKAKTPKRKRISAGILKSELPKKWKAPTVEQMNAGVLRHFRRKHRSR